MTQDEKFQKAVADHKFALDYIKELEQSLRKTRAVATERLGALRRLDPVHYPAKAKPATVSDTYTASRMIQG